VVPGAYDAVEELVLDIGDDLRALSDAAAITPRLAAR
jgi:hypothetical protein